MPIGGRLRKVQFRSQTPITRDPERLTTSIEKLMRVGVLTPEEGRHLAEDVFNCEFRALPDDWVKRPITLTLAGIQNGAGDLTSERAPSHQGSLPPTQS